MSMEKKLPKIFFYLVIFVSFCFEVYGNPTTSILNDQDVWIPNLRDVPIRRVGEIVTEFVVRTYIIYTYIFHLMGEADNL